MLFTPENAEKVKQGTKTETRRDWKSQHVYAGRVYPVRLSRKDPVPPDATYISIVTVYMERLGLITDKAAVREGLATREEFFAIWKELHGTVDMDKEIYVVRFRIATPLEIFKHQFSQILYRKKPLGKEKAVAVTLPDGRVCVSDSYEILRSQQESSGPWVRLMNKGNVAETISVKNRISVAEVN
ncbi:MAG: hypothetical protein AMDU3_IPLC00003G0022 [Thermoplasmatales archaeon I-plasma]|nr:MAG: hypothetical protein AMDU3_IPLC00003G0022 [Thermoplasmatales archaeon I-plasma]